MKKILLLMALVLLSVFYGYSQAPGIFNYQGVARNSVGNVLVNKSITLRLTLRDGSTAGPVVYQESRGVTTNPFGLFNVQVGSPGGSSVTGTIAGVNWAVGNKYLQVEIDPNGGTTFINIGTAQIASVPYALYTNQAGDLVLPFNKTQADAGTLFKITNSGTGSGSTSLEGLTNSTANNVSAIIGTVTPTGPGSFSSGVRGINNGTAGFGIGVWGSQNGNGWGVYGQTPGGIGVYGNTTTGTGVYGLSSSGTGVFGNSNTGRSGSFENTNAANASASLYSASNGTGWAADFVSTNATTRALRTAGGLRLTGINEALNRILASDATGNATWQDPASIGIVSGSGTLNFVPKWTPNGTTLGNSQLFDNGTSIGVGTITPNAVNRLEIQGIQRINATTNQEGGELRFQEGNLFGPQNHWIIDNFQSFAGGNRFRIWNDAGTQAISMMPTGRVAIGPMIFSDQPQSTLDVEGNLAVGIAYSGTTAAPANGAIIQGNVGVGQTTPLAKLHVDQTAPTSSAVLINKTDVTNTANAVNVIAANISSVGYGNSAILAQRGVIGANTFLFAGGASATAMTGISTNGHGVQGTSETGMGIIGLSYNGIGVRGYSLNSGNAGRFENLLNTGNVQPVVLVNSIANGGGVYGLHSIMESTSPGGYSSALRGEHNSTTGNGIGVYGSQSGSGWGVHGTTINGVGVYGNSQNGTGGFGYGVWGESFGASAFAGGVFRGLNGSFYGSYSDNANPAGFAASLAFQNNVSPTNGNSSAMWGLNLATNNVGFGGQFSHASGGVGVFGITGNNGTGVRGQSAGVNGHGVRGETDLGFAGLFESTNATSQNATLRVNDPNITTAFVFRKSGIYSELFPLSGANTMLAAPSAIKGVASTSLVTGNLAGAGVQGVSRNGYGVVGNTTEGVGVLGVAWGAGYGLQTSGRVQIMGQGAALSRVLTSDAVGNATWQDLSAISGVTGSGTTNYVSKWTPSGSNLGISQIYDNGIAVGIGTTTPTPAVKLDMVGTFSQMRLFDTDQASQVWLSAPGAGYTGGVGTLTNHDFPIFTNGTDKVMVKANGRVGIGTLNPAGTVEVFNNSFVGLPHMLLNESDNDYARLTLRNTNAVNTGNNFWDIAGYTNDTRANERLNFYNNATGDLVSITGDGRVGVGTFNPFVRFHANSGTDLNTAMLEAQRADNAGPHQLLFSGGQFSIIDYIRTDYTVAAEAYRRGAMELRGFSRLNFLPTNATNLTGGMTITSNGNVGIGTATPFYKVDVASTIAILNLTDTDNATQFGIAAPGAGYTGGVGTVSNHDLAIFSNNTDRVTIKANGKVGVNTFTPTGRFHVVDVAEAIRSDATYPAYATRQGANVFNTVNANYSILAKRDADFTTNNPAVRSAIAGVDSSSATTLSAGVTGFGIGNGVTSANGVYGMAGQDLNFLSYPFWASAYSGGQFWGADYGVSGAVWDTPLVGLSGINTFKIGVLGSVFFANPLGTNTSVYGAGATGGGTNWAGYFQGDVHVQGNLSASGAKPFKIDHPLDPANKFLTHFALESPEVLNVYNGNARTDANGRVQVTLPDYFEAVNKDFKYQLTIIDETQFAMARVSRKIANNQFEIMTDKPGIEVSWQVTAVRNDKSIQKYAVPAESDKPAHERGKYIDPELYGKTEADGLYRPNKNGGKPEVASNDLRSRQVDPKDLPAVAQPRQVPVSSEPTEAQVKEHTSAQQDVRRSWAEPIEKQKSANTDQVTDPNRKPVIMTEAMQDKLPKSTVPANLKAQVVPANVTESQTQLPSVTVTDSENISEMKNRTVENNKKEELKKQSQPAILPVENKAQGTEKPKGTVPTEPAGKVERSVVKQD